MKAFNRKGEPVELADGEILPDGYSIRVPAYLCDGVPTPLTTRIITDAAGRPAGSRPGFLLDADDDEAQARAAYDARSRLMQDSWKPVMQMMREQSTAPSSDDAATAREQYKNNLQNQWRTTPVADEGRPVSEADLEADRERRKQLLSEAWKTPSGVGFGGSF